MKTSWSQPSLSRDFLLLSAAILFTLALISAWVIYITYNRNTAHITIELEQESLRIDRALAAQMENASYLLTAMGRQIVLNPDRDSVKIAEMLKSFDSRGYVYSLFSWVGPDDRIVASSSDGVLDHPADFSERDYVRQAQAEPWKMAVGQPVEGRVSEHWMLPVAMGLTDYTGKFIGILMVNIDLDVLTEMIGDMAQRDGVSFAIISKSLLPLTRRGPGDSAFVKHNFPENSIRNIDFSKTPHGLLTQGNALWGTENYIYYRKSGAYPYIVLLGYDGRYSDEPMRNLLWSRLLQILTLAVFFLVLFWIIRTRMIQPVLDMTTVAARVARGEAYVAAPIAGPSEIKNLALHIQRISDYIQEIHRIEDELRSKSFMLKRDREQAQIEARGKSEFLSYSCQQMRGSLNTIIGCGQVMKDQLYGPIENRKYRQYVADICAAANQLIAITQDMMTLAKAQAGALPLTLKPLQVTEAINGALRIATDRLQAKKCQVNVQMPEDAPQLLADDFRLQQILTNLLLYALDRIPQESTLLLNISLLNDPRDKPQLALSIGLPPHNAPEKENAEEESDIRLELAKSLMTLHDGVMEVQYAPEGYLAAMTVVFDEKHLRFSPETRHSA